MARLLDRLEELLAATIVIAMAILAFANVVTRYLTNYSLAFTEELEVAALVWLTMLGAAIGVRRAAHLGFTIVRDRLPRRARRAAALLSVVLTVGTCLVLIWGGVTQIVSERSLGTISEALGIPQWTYTLAVPVGAALVLLRVLGTARRDVDRA